MRAADAGEDNARTYYPMLDALRVFAAISVLVLHLHTVLGLPVSASYPWVWFRLGLYGVEIFFALSGAVILQALWAEREASATGYRRRFLWRRWWRIAPLLVVTGAIDIVLNKPGFFDRADAWPMVAAHLGFVHNIFPFSNGGINGPSWTLGLEMQFYLVIALVGAVFLDSRRAIAWLLLLVACGLAWRATWHWLLAGDPAKVPLLAHLDNQLIGAIDAFAAGMLVMVAHWKWGRRLLPRTRARLAAAFLVAALCLWGRDRDRQRTRAGLLAVAGHHDLDPQPGRGSQRLQRGRMRAVRFPCRRGKLHAAGRQADLWHLSLAHAGDPVRDAVWIRQRGAEIAGRGRVDAAAGCAGLATGREARDRLRAEGQSLVTVRRRRPPAPARPATTAAAAAEAAARGTAGRHPWPPDGRPHAAADRRRLARGSRRGRRGRAPGWRGIRPAVRRCGRLRGGRACRGSARAHRPRPPAAGWPGFEVTVSNGLATLRAGDAAGVEDWLQAADKALYEAKAAGRNRVHVAGAGDGRRLEKPAPATARP